MKLGIGKWFRRTITPQQQQRKGGVLSAQMIAAGSPSTFWHKSACAYSDRYNPPLDLFRARTFLHSAALSLLLPLFAAFWRIFSARCCCFFLSFSTIWGEGGGCVRWVEGRWSNGIGVMNGFQRARIFGWVFSDSLLSVCRTAIWDEIRSGVTIFYSELNWFFFVHWNRAYL